MHFPVGTASPLILLLLQITVVLVSVRIMGYVMTRIGQPPVIGEILAGIMLGPSVIGSIFPGFSTFLFSPDSLGNLKALSEIGLILFMFVVGLELDLRSMWKQANSILIISQASIIIPWLMGIGLASFLYSRFAPAGISFLSFSLFMGIAMSITAFPVLARIIHDRGLSKSNIGSMAITCAAAGDIMAWFLLAIVLNVVKNGSPLNLLFTILLSLTYIAFMFLLVRPFMASVGGRQNPDGEVSKPFLMITLVLLLVSAGLAEWVGLHFLFGAFLAGAIFPYKPAIRKLIADKIEHLDVTLLLPLFFAFTGLRTQIGLLNTGHLWEICGYVIMVAVAGKFGGSTIAARLAGQGPKDSLLLGVLMNTRGLMELVILNIGFDLGILSPALFTIFVIMALVTTFLTSPAFDWVNRLVPDKPLDPDAARTL